MFIYRKILDKIEPFLARKEIIALLGPRQAGKTTLLQYIQGLCEADNKKVLFLTFEKTADLELFESGSDDFLAKYGRYEVIIIDEFQYAKNGGKQLKYLFDTTQIKFIISGSSSFDLKYQTLKYLVGRIVSFYVWPFSFSEYIGVVDPDLDAARREKKLSLFEDSSRISAPLSEQFVRRFEEYAVWGGYPEAVLSSQIDIRRTLIENIFDTYITRDIRSLLQLATDRELITLIRLLSGQIGSTISYTELSRAIGISSVQVKHHISILSETFITFLLSPFFGNRRSEVIKTPKVYFFDTGVRNFALNDFRSLGERADAGTLVENAFFINHIAQHGTDSLHYWRTKNQAEVDFVWRVEGKIIPIEIKYSSNPKPGKSFYSFLERYKSQDAYILTKDVYADEKILETQVKYRPVWYV